MKTASKKGISRRDFIKYTASAAAMSSLGIGNVLAKERPASELVVGLSGDPGHLDPTIEAGGVGWTMFSHMFDAAVFHDRNSDLIPWLVERWEQVTPTVLRFHLKKGVKFHSGDPFTAEAIKTTYQKVTAPDSRHASRNRLKPIIGYKIHDPYTLDLITAKPNRPMLRMSTITFIISPEALKKYGDSFSTNPVGTGTFKFVEYRPGELVAMERNSDYFRAKANFERLNFRFIRENGTRVASLEAGEVMAINNVPPDQIARLRKNPKLDVMANPTFRMMYTSIMNTRPPFDNKRVRQAMNYAVDKEALTKGLMGGMAQIATAPLPADMWTAHPNLPPYTYDPKRARKMLEEEGAIGAKYHLGIANGRYLMDKQVGEAVAGYLQAAGLDVIAEAPAWSSLISQIQTGEKCKYDGAVMGYGLLFGEPAQMMYDMFNSASSKRRRTMYKNSEVDKLTKEASEIFDREKIEKNYRRAQEIIWDECPWIWLYRVPDITAKVKRLNWKAGRADELLMFHDAFLM